MCRRNGYMTNRLAFLFAALLVVLSACGGSTESTTTSTEPAASETTATEAPADEPVEEPGPFVPSPNLVLEEQWATEEDIAIARETVDAWEAVWQAQADYPFQMTVSFGFPPTYQSDFDADGTLLSTEVFEPDVLRNETLMTIEDFFDFATRHIRRFEDRDSLSRGEFIGLDFDPVTGALMSFDCGTGSADCDGISIEITPN